MDSLLTELQQWLPLFIVVYAVVSGVVLWLARRASIADVKEVETKWDGIERRVSSLEQMGKHMPTREDLHLMRIEMIDAKNAAVGLVKEMEADRRTFAIEMRSARERFDQQIESTEKQMDSTMQLLSRTERTAQMLLDHLLNRGV